MTLDERLTEIRAAWEHVEPGRITVTDTATPGQLLHALSRAPRDVPWLLEQVERLESAIQGGLAHVGVEIQRADQAEAKVERLATQMRQLKALTHDTDGNLLPPESELPVGVFYGVLYGESASGPTPNTGTPTS